jgi:hypothetical protein
MQSQALMEAMRELQLTPQEQYIYQHHLGNLARGGVRQPNGDISTFLNTTVDFGGRTYVLPTVWDNQIVDEDTAIQRAQAAGLQNFPSYGSVEEAEKRYQAMHGYMERDTSAYSIRQPSPANNPGAVARP